LILGSIKLEKVDKSKFKSFYISSTIEDALDEYPFQGNERSLVHWGKGDDFTYQGNKIYTKLILQNLIKNSIYFIREAGHGEIFIDVIVAGNGKQNKLIFKDTACGISNEDLPHVFEAFYSKRPGGSGLGLSFCKRIMESYDGNITIQTSTQKGSEFTEFTLEFPII
jgi:two-component system, CAI-1 autoinducer sensor kinase/phosphatase CqsS